MRPYFLTISIVLQMYLVWLSLNTSASIYGAQKRTLDPRPRTGVRGGCDVGIRTNLRSSMRTVSILARTVPAPEAIILRKTLSCTDEGLRLQEHGLLQEAFSGLNAKQEQATTKALKAQS